MNEEERENKRVKRASERMRKYTSVEMTSQVALQTDHPSKTA